jgi:hypothetical protein
MKTNWTNSRLGAHWTLTGSQVKALLQVASDLPADPAAMPYHDLIAAAADERTSVPELTRLKDTAKGLTRTAEDAPHREAAQLLYHLAVVAAFVRHGAEISGRPMRKQQIAYDRYAASFAGQPIGELFRDALSRIACDSPDE